MAQLNTRPGSSSKKQHQVLVMAGRRQGFDLAEIRRMVGGSLRKLSAAEASEWITRFSGQELANPPGKKPRSYAGRKRSDAVRMITDDHIDQIARLGLDYFGDPHALHAWLAKNFGIPFIEPRLDQTLSDLIRTKLATARRAADVIHTLKTMLSRRKTKEIRA